MYFLQFNLILPLISGIIDDQPLKFRGEVYHPYHFNCTSCGVELDANAREVRSRAGYAANDMNELYCLRCHDKMGNFLSFVALHIYNFDASLQVFRFAGRADAPSRSGW